MEGATVHIVTPKRTTNIIIFFSLIVSFSAVSILAATTAFMVTDKIYTGVSVGDIMIGGMSTQEAQVKIQRSFENRIKQPPITLIYQENEWPISADDIELSIDAANLADQAYSIGRRGNFFQQLCERYVTINYGHSIPLIPSYNNEKLKSVINTAISFIDREPHNAELFLDGSGLKVIPEVIGRKVAVNNLMESMYTRIYNNVPFVVEIPVADITPSVFVQDFKEIDGVIAIYTTHFDASNSNRMQNIRVAAKSINGTLIRSGEVFSFNERVGPRLVEYGYKEAPVFIEGKLVPDIGGGVCQVSSTLYNAALLADMSIEERTSHFRPPGYVPLGQDATVADNLLDFRFRNTLPYNVYIYNEMYEGKFTVYILGKNNINRDEIEIVAADKKILEPNTIIKQDPVLELGKEVIENQGQKGFKISTYRVKRNNGKEISRDFLFTDEFQPEDRIVRVGTRVLSSKGIK